MAGYGIRISTFYAALFLIYGVHLPYLPLWLEGRGLSAAEIGMITSAPFFLRLVATPSLAYVADRNAGHARMIVLLAWLALASALLLSQMWGFWPILIAALVLAISVYTIMPLTETIAIGGVRLGLDYGRMRLWGSLTFIAASFAGGAAVDWAGRSVGIWLIAIGCAATVAAAYFLPSPGDAGNSRRRHAARAKTAALEPPLAPVPRKRGIDRAMVIRLARHPMFITFLLAIGTVQAAHAMFYTFGAIHWRANGLSSAWIGTLWGIGVMTEVALFAVSGRLVAWLGPVRLMLVGALAAVVRWAAMSVDPPLGWLLLLQVLHGLTYGASHLGAIHFISRAVPQAAGGTAQAFYATLASGVMQGAATLLSGVLYARYGGSAYLAMSLLAGIGLMAGLVLVRSWHGGLLWQDDEQPSPIHGDLTP
jgi:PPP family 3-phenylpropionic acid transporter